MNYIPSMEEQFTKKLIEIIEANFNNEQFGVSELAREMGMSRATLHRKIKLVSNKTVSQFISEVRLKTANQLLINRSGTVSEVSYMVGFGSSTYFIKCFKEQFGYSPGEVLKENFKVIESKPEANKNAAKKVPLSLKIGVPVASILLLFLFIKYLNNDSLTSELPPPSTENQAALNLYLQGLNLMDVYAGSQDAGHYIEAKRKYEEAVLLDSTFGDAYSHIAGIYLSHIPFSDVTNKGFNYADSGRIFIKKAEHFGVGNTDFLLQMKSIYFQSIQDYNEALHILELRWENKEKNYHYYSERGNHGYLMRDNGATVENLLAYLELKPKSEMPQYDKLMKLTLTFSRAGFQNEAQEFAYRQFELINDSAKYWNWYSRIIFEAGNLDETIKYYEAAYNRKESGTTIFNKLLEMYMLTGQTDIGLKLLPEYLAYNKKISSSMVPNYLLGYYHHLKGEKNLSVTHFRSEIRRWEYFCEANGTQESISNYLTIAACYSMLHEKDGTIESLRKLAGKSSIPFLVVLKLQKSPMFDHLRQNEDFVKIRKEIEDKYYNEQSAIQSALKKYPVEPTYTQKGVIPVNSN